MKKRRELDALVSGKSNGRRKRKGGQDILLENMSDSSENEEFSIPGKTIVRKRGFCQFCSSCASLCGFLMLVACVISIVAIVWVHIELKQELDDLKDLIAQVESGNQGNPAEFQDLHKKIQDLEKVITIGENKRNELYKNTTEINHKIDKINSNLVIMRADLIAAKKTSPSNQLDTIEQTLANLGSDMKSVHDDIQSLQAFKTTTNNRLVTVETSMHSETQRADANDDIEKLQDVREQLVVLDGKLTSLDSVVAVNISSIAKQSTQSQVQIQGLVDTTNALKEDVDVLKLSVNAAVTSSPQTPAEAFLDSGSIDQAQPVDRVMLEGLVQSYVANSSLAHTSDMEALRLDVQQQVSDLSTRVDILQTGTDFVTGETFMGYKNTVTALQERMRGDLNETSRQVVVLESGLRDQGERLTRLEQEVHSSPSDGFAVEGTENDANQKGGPAAGDKEAGNTGATGLIGGDDGHLPDFVKIPDSDAGATGLIGGNDGHLPGFVHLPDSDTGATGSLLGGNDGHLPDFVQLPTAEEVVSTEAPVATEENKQPVERLTIRDDKVTSPEDLSAQFRMWDEDGDGYVTYDDLVAFLGQNFASWDAMQAYDVNADDRYDVIELQTAFGFPAADDSLTTGSTDYKEAGETPTWQ